MALEQRLRLTVSEMREIAALFRNYLDEDDALVQIRARLAEIYGRRSTAQEMIMSRVLESESTRETVYLLNRDNFRLETTSAIPADHLGPLISRALEPVRRPRLPQRPHLVEDLDHRERLGRLGFGKPFVDFGDDAFGASCLRCFALVVDDGRDESLVTFGLHANDHRNTDRAIIGAAGESQEGGLQGGDRTGGTTGD